MNVAHRFSDQPNFILDLKPTVLYLLASPSTPPEVLDKVMLKVEKGKQVRVEQVTKMIREVKQGSKIIDDSSVFDDPAEVERKELARLEENLKKKLRILIEESEKVEKELDHYYRKIQDRTTFIGKVQMLFRIKEVSEKSMRVLKTLTNPEKFAHFFNLSESEA
jgi:hypothetical protein